MKLIFQLNKEIKFTMIVDIINSSTNMAMPIEVLEEELDDFTTGDLYECILDLLDVETSELLMYYNKVKIEDSNHLYCKDVFNNKEYVKIYVYPKIVSNALYNTDLSGYNYIEFMQDIYRRQKLEEMKEEYQYDKAVSKLNRYIRMNELKHKHHCKTIEGDLRNPDMSNSENLNTNNKMQDILSRIKK